MDDKSQQPLAGIKVLDLTRLLPGPVATMHLADMGASVIKIEDRGVGDYARSMGYVRKDVSLFFVAVNRGKQFVRLDLKNTTDRETFLNMVSTADVVIESFRPGVMDKLGLGWEVLKQHNPSLVMCATSGYGQDGPFAHIAGHDINYLGYAGVLQQIADQHGTPVIPNLQIADLLGGAQSAVQGILAALIGAKLQGVGRFVDVSMTDSSFAHNIMPLAAVNNNGNTTEPGCELLNGGSPCYNIYRTSDQRYMAVGALELKFWELFCETVQQPEWKPRHWSKGQVADSADAQQLRVEIQELFSQHTLVYWTKLFANIDCCVTPILSTDEALQHPLFQARGMCRKLSHETEGEYWATAPAVKFKP